MPKNLPTTEEFNQVSEWVFDLDNTLYPRHTDLFSQIDQKMTTYVSDLLRLPRDEARKVQKEYYRDYGTSIDIGAAEVGRTIFTVTSAGDDMDSGFFSHSATGSELLAFNRLFCVLAFADHVHFFIL